jgi:MoxR-like ATPase
MPQETETLALVLQTPGCLPALVWGDFGIGKTSRILQLAEALGMDCEVLRPAERGEGALGVVPVPSEDRRVLHYPLPDWAARFSTTPEPGGAVRGVPSGLIFLDEVSSTPPALQPAIMGLALDGIIAGQRLPEGVRRVAAANPVDQAAGGWELAPALANRFVHLHWPSPSAGEWSAWLAGHDGRATDPRLDLGQWEIEWGKAKALGQAFMRSHPSMLHEDVSKCLGRTPPAYATPRTWECALRLLASCRAAGREDLYPALAQGSIGPAVALEGKGSPQGAWLVWLKENDLPDPEELLADPEKFEHDPKRPDRSYATLLAVAEAGLATVNGKKLSVETRNDRWEAAMGVLCKAYDLGAGKDMVLLAAEVLVDKPGKGSRRPPPPKNGGPAVGPNGNRIGKILYDFIDLFAESK